MIAAIFDLSGPAGPALLTASATSRKYCGPISALVMVTAPVQIVA
jgi:hypothetical protein